MLASRISSKLSDPYGFVDALRDLGLSPDDLPGLTREARLTGAGV